MNTRQGFTLIEMLVVVAIIVLLIGIALPVLGRGKAAARHSVCVSNLSQLSHAADGWSLDQQGRFFEYRATVTTPAAGTAWWFGFEPGSALTSNRPLDHERGPLGLYLAGIGERLQCGDFPYDHSGFVPKFERHAASYGYNWRLSGTRKLGPSELPDETVKPHTRHRYRDRLADVFVFADSVFFEPNPSPTAFFEGFYIAWQNNLTTLSGYAHFRHFDHANLAMIDGHVETQPLRGGFHKVVNGAKAGNLTTQSGTTAMYGD